MSKLVMGGAEIVPDSAQGTGAREDRQVYNPIFETTVVVQVPLSRGDLVHAVEVLEQVGLRRVGSGTRGGK